MYKPKRPCYTKEHLQTAYMNLRSNEAEWIHRHSKKLRQIHGVGLHGAREILAAVGELFAEKDYPREE